VLYAVAELLVKNCSGALCDCDDIYT